MPKLQVHDLDILRVEQRLHIEIREGRRTVGLSEVPGECDAERAAHFFFFPLQPARSLVTASWSALCSTQTSPE